MSNESQVGSFANSRLARGPLLSEAELEACRKNRSEASGEVVGAH
ncbi:MAG: hypothetical protein KatS3mg031_1362 [Chitinophagales bacterium]|nr:MAG: hypothetical protein KatS3mg031_1362 [Chitinophagales bacterium]